MKIPPYLILAFVLVVCFSLATGIEQRALVWSHHGKSDNVFSVLFGNGQKLFASQFFTMADVYFHSGYYPSIFEQRQEGTKAIVTASQGQEENEEAEKKADFLGKPKDWIDRFGRHFRITEHLHLEHGNEREILPWLRLAADMDPQMIETYVVGAFFLRDHLKQPQEAEMFLREGLRNNPDSHEILFELGRIYHESFNDTDHARNVWEQGVKKWLTMSPEDQKENKLAFDKLAVSLAWLERDAGHYEDAIRWLQAAQMVSPTPDALQKQIDEIKVKMAAQTNTPVGTPH